VPDAIQAVDIHHAGEHVGDAARAIPSDSSRVREVLST